MGLSIEICLSESLRDRFSSSRTITFGKLPSSLPKSFLRRSSQLTKQVLSFSEFIFASSPTYLVFATQHGELNRTLNLLYSIAQQQELSPTQFAQSVHSTAPGILTIANNRAVPFTTVCAGEDTLIMAMVEALSHLRNDPKAEVCVIFADEKAPSELVPFIGNKSEYSLVIRFRQGGAYVGDVTPNKNAQVPVSTNENIEHMLAQIAQGGDIELRSSSFNLTWKQTKHEHATP